MLSNDIWCIVKKKSCKWYTGDFKLVYIFSLQRYWAKLHGCLGNLISSISEDLLLVDSTYRDPIYFNLAQNVNSKALKCNSLDYLVLDFAARPCITINKCCDYCIKVCVILLSPIVSHCVCVNISKKLPQILYRI